MLRIIFIILIVLTAGFLFLQGRLLEKSADKPIFLSTDEIANTHQTKINTIIHSRFKPDSVQLETLKTDYSNLWAHLNHLYATNDVEAGKEYYTEGWFKQICSHYKGVGQYGIARQDVLHKVIVENWSEDGLLCTITDSAAQLHYSYQGNPLKKTTAKIAMVLLYQGDHWRIDAMRVTYEACIE